MIGIDQTEDPQVEVSNLFSEVEHFSQATMKTIQVQRSIRKTSDHSDH